MHVQAELRALEGDQDKQSGPSLGQSSRGSDSSSAGSVCHYNSGRSSQGCYDFGSLTIVRETIPDEG